MFRFKSIIVILVLVSCTPKQEECVELEHNHHIEVVSKTDSILSYADQKIHKIKQHQLEQRVFVDSLRYEIYTEQTTINTIQTELDIRMDVEKNLQLTRQELESALVKCKKKEKELKELNEEFVLKAEYYFDREVKLINAYSHKLDSLKSVIELLKQPNNIDINTPDNNNRRRRRNNNN